MKKFKKLSVSYKEKGIIRTALVGYASGTIPAYSNTYYWMLWPEAPKNYEEGQKTLIAKVTEKQLDKKNLKKVEEIYGRAWLKEVLAKEKLYLVKEDMDDYSELPNDTVAVWRIDNVRKGNWIIETEKGAILHVSNNTEKFKAGKFQDAIRKLLPGQTIVINRVKTEEVIN